MPFKAVPVTVYVTVVAVLDGFVMLNVYNPLAPPSAALAVVAVTLTIAVSLSTMFTVAGVVSTVIAAFEVLTNVITTFSEPSTIKSFVTVTGKVILVALAGITIVVAIVV